MDPGCFKQSHTATIYLFLFELLNVLFVSKRYNCFVNVHQVTFLYPQNEHVEGYPCINVMKYFN